MLRTGYKLQHLDCFLKRLIHIYGVWIICNLHQELSLFHESNFPMAITSVQSSHVNQHRLADRSLHPAQSLCQTNFLQRVLLHVDHAVRLQRFPMLMRFPLFIRTSTEYPLKVHDDSLSTSVSQLSPAASPQHHWR